MISRPAPSLIAEADAVCEATGSRLAPYAAAMLAAFRGREAEAAPLIEATLEQAAAGGQGAAVPGARWVTAVLCNGLGRYEEALAAARQASEHEHAFAARVGAARADRGRRPHREHCARPAMPWNGWPKGPGPAAPTGGWGSRRAAARC